MTACCEPLLVRNISFQAITGWGPGSEWVCLVPASSVWVLDFMQEKCHNRSPGDFESMFIKAGNSETRKGLGQ